ncbi:MAG: mechanosensitive ion channel protein MscS [Flavobacteriales bacterium]|nr:mechanosensitive ion channel protein MscS [Flavobacteriales bacterium]|tara:strand:+ start:3196 stop:4458 length:1263 start_codon:yes stop_codon:yes gene_type:complete
MDKIHWASDWLANQHIDERYIEWIALGIDFILLALLSLIADFLSRRILVSIIHAAVKRSKATWDDYFFEQKVFKGIAHLVPAAIVYNALHYVLSDVPRTIPVFEKIVVVYIIVLLVTLVNRTLRALENWLSQNEKYTNTPVRTISQVVRLLAFFGAGISLISILTGTSAGAILGAFAGTTAILILVFQDSIKGLLANFQIHMYDLVKVGDWITFSNYGVDGDVLSIDLTTIKVQNFDKTVSTVPATAFVQDSFVNWRGMSESGSRRIKRNIYIDITSIRHLDKGLMDALIEIDLINPFMIERQKEIDNANSKEPSLGSNLLNGRRQTNIGLYRKYIELYLKNHADINNDFTLMVRQLQPTTEGIPVEVYCFAATTDWSIYEGIMSDIFDHLYAATSHFDLSLYQKPTGSDLRALKSNQNP